MPALVQEDYYRRNLTVPFLDEMVAPINSRLSEIQKKAMMALLLVSSVLMSPEHEQSMTDLAHQLAEFDSTRTTSPIHQHFSRSYTYGSGSGRASQLSDLRRFQSHFSMLMRLFQTSTSCCKLSLLCQSPAVNAREALAFYGA